MSEMPNIVNMNDLEWEEAHYSGWSKRLTPSMNRKEGHIGGRAVSLSSGDICKP